MRNPQRVSLLESDGWLTGVDHCISPYQLDLTIWQPFCPRRLRATTRSSPRTSVCLFSKTPVASRTPRSQDPATHNPPSSAATPSLPTQMGPTKAVRSTASFSGRATQRRSRASLRQSGPGGQTSPRGAPAGECGQAGALLGHGALPRPTRASRRESLPPRSSSHPPGSTR